MTDVSDEYARAMDETPMSSDDRATALIAEAARMIDRSIRHLPHGVSSNESLKLVELIVEAAVERMSAKAPIAGVCVHDLTNPSHTMVVSHDVRTGHEFDSTARCKVCRKEFAHPLRSLG
jgi:hypothetical protein